MWSGSNVPQVLQIRKDCFSRLRRGGAGAGKGPEVARLPRSAWGGARQGAGKRRMGRGLERAIRRRRRRQGSRESRRRFGRIGSPRGAGSGQPAPKVPGSPALSGFAISRQLRHHRKTASGGDRGDDSQRGCTANPRLGLSGQVLRRQKSRSMRLRRRQAGLGLRPRLRAQIAAARSRAHARGGGRRGGDPPRPEGGAIRRAPAGSPGPAGCECRRRCPPACGAGGRHRFRWR